MPDINLLLKLLTEFAWLGNWLFFALAFFESAPFIGVFMPGATLISIGGFLASQGILKTWDIVIFAAIGAILGDFFSYSLGRWGGKFINNKKIINGSILRHGEKFFIKYGNTSIFWGRFFGPLRATIPFIAGVSKMKQRPFIFWNILSGIGWAILNVFLGYFSGSLVVAIAKRWSSGMSLILVFIIMIASFYWIIKKKNESLKNSFLIGSLNFIKYLNNKKWFNNLTRRHYFIVDFFSESKYPAEKLFGSFLILSFLISTYILVLILDVF
jgi:membrane protein DedA with SNARE-associated domain